MSYMGSRDSDDDATCFECGEHAVKRAFISSRIGSHIELRLNLYDSEAVKSSEKLVNHQDRG